MEKFIQCDVCFSRCRAYVLEVGGDKQLQHLIQFAFDGPGVCARAVFELKHA